jgi:glycosyltransferase involved in cell wall biosynthesis
MRIGLVTPIYPGIGGVERFSQYLKKVFPNMEIFSHSGKSRFWFLSEEKMAFSLGSKIKKEHKKKPFDIVFANGMFGWNLGRIPSINVFHGGYKMLAENCFKGKDRMKYFLANSIHSRFEKKSSKNKICVSVSENSRKDLEKYYDISSRVIPNCVDTEVFKPMSKKKVREELGLPANKEIILFVGRLEYCKGFDVLQEIAKKNSDKLFLCVNPTKTEDEGNLFYRTCEDMNEMPKYYNAADRVVVSSRYESFSLVFLEALACNVPAFANTEIIPTEIKGHVQPLSGINPNTKNRSTREFIQKNFSFKIFERNHKKLVAEVLG